MEREKERGKEGERGAELEGEPGAGWGCRAGGGGRLEPQARVGEEWVHAHAPSRPATVYVPRGFNNERTFHLSYMVSENL
jgi:hypothetical protein